MTSSKLYVTHTHTAGVIREKNIKIKSWYNNVLQIPPPSLPSSLPSPLSSSQECWDKDRFSDDFMGSIQFTEQDLVKFEEGPKWFRLQHVKTGEILLVMKKISGAEEELEWSHLDEASRPLHLVGESKLAACLW